MAQPGPSLLRARPAPAGVAALLLCALALAPAVRAQVPAVQEVAVRLEVEGPVPAPPIRARLEETVDAVARRLLVGRPLGGVREGQRQLESVLRTVLDRVVAGYAVTAGQIDPGPTSTVLVRLRPDPPLIRRVVLRPRAEVHPRVWPLLEAPVARQLAPAAATLLTGLPVAAVDWAGPLVVAELRRVAEAAVPGYTLEAQLAAGAETVVAGRLVPRDSRVVRNIGVRFRSSSIPTILLDQHAPVVASFADPLRGLPVAFAEAHRAALEGLVAAALAAYPPVVQYHIVARPALRVGETTVVTVVADSLLYRARLQAVITVGAQAPPPELQVSLGRLFGAVEVFGQLAVTPNTLELRYDLGVAVTPTPAWQVGVAKTLNSPRLLTWTAYTLSPDVDVRLALEGSAGTVETSVRYRLNEFQAGELVATSRGDVWLRLLSNL